MILMPCNDWNNFKDIAIEKKGLKIQFTETGKHYDIYSDEGLFVWHYKLIKNSGAEQTDFESKYKSLGNLPTHSMSKIVEESLENKTGGSFQAKSMECNIDSGAVGAWSDYQFSWPHAVSLLAASWSNISSNELDEAEFLIAPDPDDPRLARTHPECGAGKGSRWFKTIMNKPFACNRREFLQMGAGAIATATAPRMLAAADPAVAPAKAKAGLARLSELDAFNYVLGTQTIGATYQFTEESVLVETARAILAMGSNLLKFTMGRGCEHLLLKSSKSAYPDTMQYLLNQGSDARDTPRIQYPGGSAPTRAANPDIQTLTDLAKLEPVFRQVFEMPFARYMIWTYAFTPTWWHRGFSEENQAKEYQEIRAFVAHLLRTYSGTGKTFFLGHWEGDWHLRPDLNAKSDAGVTPESIQGMIDWLNTRQKAVDDAKRETPHHDVQVYHYCEVNHVAAVAMEGRPCVTNSVLPQTNVDYVAYSTYDALSDIPNKLPKALAYLESKLPPKPGLAGQLVFIGEYGFPARTVPEATRVQKSHQVMRAGLERSCPFVLSWQMYNNEFKNGQENGYWLIDDQGKKQPLWQTHHNFLREAQRHVADFQRKHDRLPTTEEFCRQGLTLLDELAQDGTW